MPVIQSRCCEYEVSFLPEVEPGYCYVCGEVHKHDHLDLREISELLLCEVTEKHTLNWQEVSKDKKKLSGMIIGNYCQSLLTELTALCEHGSPVISEGEPLRLHMCYGADSVVQGNGLDFTTDLCGRERAQIGKIPDGLGFLAENAAQIADQFKVGDVLRYNKESASFRCVLHAQS